MPERAEIEAVARAISLHHGWVEAAHIEAVMTAFGPDARSAISALDRVRDARGDDEARLDGAGHRRYPKMLHGEAATAARHAEHARSPQGEDHEAALTEAFTLLRAVHEEGADMTWELHGKIRAFLDGQNTDGG